jgi:undecaprenyl diphosphate synthase
MSTPATAEVLPPIPRHVAIIMDGNGRWAKERGLPRTEGHRRGVDAVQRIVEACSELGVGYLTLYAFSSENWKRPRLEVEALMKLLEYFLKHKLATMLKNNVRFQAIGRLHMLPERCQQAIRDTIAKTASNTGTTLVLALSYGGREEIIDGVRSLMDKALAGTISPADLTPELFAQQLYTRDMPDPDLLIRSSGELRLSNFLLWQISYSEIYITPQLWPDFDKASLIEAFRAFAQRERRYGGI